MRAPGADEEARRGDVEALATSYWAPVYGYLRARWKLDQVAALDRTQEFFLWMLERSVFDKADRSRGRFRAFLKTTLGNWLTDRARADLAQKRGAGELPISIEGAMGGSLEIRDDVGKTPDEVLDDRWRRELVRRALDEVEEEFRREGRPVYFSVFQDYFVAAETDLDYAELADRYSISRHDVSNYLRKAKQRYRARLRQIVADTVTTPAELEEELAWLFGSEA